VQCCVFQICRRLLARSDISYWGGPLQWKNWVDSWACGERTSTWEYLGLLGQNDSKKRTEASAAIGGHRDTRNLMLSCRGWEGTWDRSGGHWNLFKNSVVARSTSYGTSIVNWGVGPAEKSAADSDLRRRMRLPEPAGGAWISMSMLILSQAALYVSQDLDGGL
jgi:hypothetical protein